MSTVSERRVRRIGKQREKRQWDAIMRRPHGITMPVGPGAEYRYIGPQDAPWVFGTDVPSEVTRREIEDILSGLDAPIDDRRTAESKTERPWWRFW